MQITFVQTADPVRYSRMLAATSRTVVEYCRRHGHAYESYLGIKRGVHGWQATFNRIYQLGELLDRGVRGWAVYMDADAYIADLDFDLAAYLGDKVDRLGLLVTTPESAERWNVNAGVVLLNLDHPLARRFVDGWRAKFLALSDERLVEMDRHLEWDNDQQMLYFLLSEDETIRDAFFYDDNRIINAVDARFIRQYLTAIDASLETRTATIEDMVTEIMPGESTPSATQGQIPALVRSLYQAVLGREPDPDGFAHFAGMLGALGVGRGTHDALRVMLASDEYRALRG